MWKTLLDRKVALLQRIIVRIRNNRRILGMIGLVMAADFSQQPLKFGFGLRLAQRIDRLGFVLHLRHSGIVSVVAQLTRMKSRLPSRLPRSIGG
jgi:hypothetical protein